MNKLYSLPVTFLIALLVVSCGGGGGGAAKSDGLSATTASVGVTLADSSTPESDAFLATVMDECGEATLPEDCEEIPTDCPDDNCMERPQLLIQVTRVELLGRDGPEEIFNGSESFNLFELKKGVELTFLADGVNPGVYSKIRMHVDGEPMLISLKHPAPGIEVKLPGDKIDLNPRGPFKISAGDTVLIKLDWHARKSIKKNGNGELMMRPVIFVDIETDSDGPDRPGLEQRIVRASGTVGEVVAEGFQLCMYEEIIPFSANETEEPPARESDCADVVVTDKTGLFDENGEPMLFSELATGYPVTVVGLLRKAADTMDECDEAGIPENECNMVTPLTAIASSSDNAGDAPSASDKDKDKSDSDKDHSDSDKYCDSDSDSDSDSHSNSDGHSDSDGSCIPDTRFEIVAAVVEGGLPGTWIRERGTLETAPDDMGEFDLRLNGPDGRLLTGKVYPETRILLVSKEDGITEITAAELAAGDRAIVEAVFVPGDDLGPTPKQDSQDCSELSAPEDCVDIPEKLDGTLRISIMLVTMGGDGGVPTNVVAGKLLTANAETGVLEITTRDDDPVVCVEANSETVILQATITQDGVDVIKAGVGDLLIGGLILAETEATDASGVCLIATLIVAQGPDKPEGPVTPD
jgi:hypothetical protein